MNKQNIVLLCSDGMSTRAIYNALQRSFDNVTVVMEEPMSRLQMAKRRSKKLGYFKVASQIVFVAVAVPILSRLARGRVKEIELEYALDTSWNSAEPIRVKSVNSEECRSRLRSTNPSVVVVNGTRIVETETLESVKVPFINTHAGITPLFRGVHGGYWALVEGHSELVGTTVHLVDTGIDTGKIIEQAFFGTSKRDNFATYPYLHTAVGIPILLEAVKKCLSNELETKNPLGTLGSKLRYHPTIWQYLYYRLRNGVR